MTIESLQLIRTMKLLAGFGGAFRTYAWEDWKAVGPNMVSPGGRKLKYETWQRLKSAAEAKAPVGTAVPKPEQEAPVPFKVPAGPQPANVTVAQSISDKLKKGEAITAKDLWAIADKAYGGSRGQGKYGPSQAYDAMEAGVNLAMQGKSDPTQDAESAKKQIQQIGTDFVRQLPTQTNRSGNKDLLQQFSTPPHYAFAATWVANLNKGDTVLEPSAGTGNIAVHALNSGAKVYGNELDPDRAELLDKLLGKDKVSGENAEQIAGILPKRGVNPTVVVMNPPFSSTAGRTGKRDIHTASKHINEALAMLPPGGRLVAIVGEGMKPGAPAYNPWFRRIAEQYSLRANVGVAGEEYTKSGTSFGTRLLVIDKVPPTGDKLVSGDVSKTSQLIDLLEGVRNGRPQLSEPAASVTNRGRNAAAAKATAAGTSGIPGSTGVPGVGLTAGSAVGAGGVGTAVVDGTAANGGADVRPGSRGVRSRGRLAAGAAVGSAGGTTPAVRGGAGGDAVGGTAAAGAGATGRQPPGDLSGLRPPERLKLEPEQPRKAESPEQTEDSQFEQYKPQARFAGSVPHKASLAESAAMSAVRAPTLTYTPTLSPDLVTKGELSDAQLEAVAYAGQAHQAMLPADENGVVARRGYFIGDGTGVGKGRQIAGIISDNWNQGRKKHVWVSMKAPLLNDAKRDWSGLGGDPNAVVPFEAIAKGKTPPKEGIVFVTYDTLKGGPKDKTAPQNLAKLVEWLGRPDFDGTINFDEAHSMGNAIESKAGIGTKKASQKGLAGLDLQKAVPNARITYVSATGATEVSNLAYADRLGIWGKGTPFATKQKFIDEMKTGGVAAMECVAQSLKAQGKYGARALSFNDGTPTGTVTYERVQHVLQPHEREMYDGLATGWQKVLQNIDKALESSGAGDDNQAKAAAKSQFWGAQQRFFNQLLTSIQTPTTISNMEKDIKAGKAPVVQLVNTMEAATARALDGAPDGESMENIDVSPKEILISYLERSFPIHRFEKYMDSEGNERSRPVETYRAGEEGVSLNGRMYAPREPIPPHIYNASSPEARLKVVREPVIDPAAQAMRDELIEGARSYNVPEAPLDQIISHFGVDNVAECTGRSQRLVWKRGDNGKMERVLEPRTPSSANVVDADAFQSGKKKLLIFSDAGGTGRSYHADNAAANTNQRVHYLLQPGWRADNAVQGLGRTHRTNQKTAPTYRLVEVDAIKAQRRFISTIARRLDQLGALTRGQRQAGSGGLFKAADNLESPESKKALQRFFDDLQRGDVPGLHFDEVAKQMGFAKDDGKAAKKMDDAPPMNQFLNRMLSLRVDTQQKVFEAFDQRLQATVADAERSGTLDTGVEDFKANKIVHKDEKVVYRDPESGAETKLMTATITVPTNAKPFKITKEGELPLGYVKNKRSGRVRAVYKALSETDSRTGFVHQRVRIVGPTGSEMRPAHEFEDPEYGNWEPLDEKQAKSLWEAEYAEAPKEDTYDQSFLTGALLPVWDKIPKDKPKIFRIRPEGRSPVVGRYVYNDAVPAILERLGVAGGERKQHEPSDVHTALTTGGNAKLANGWGLRQVRFGFEPRIELTGPDVYDSTELAQLRSDGVIVEKQGFANKLFVPTGPDGVEVLRKLAASRPITEVKRKGEGVAFSEQPFTVFSWEDWTQQGDRMVSPSGKRKLTLEGFAKLKARAPSKPVAGDAPAKPAAPVKSGPLTPIDRISTAAEKAAQEWATGKFYNGHRLLVEKAIHRAKLPTYMPSATTRKPEQLQAHYGKLSEELGAIDQQLSNIPLGNAGYFQKEMLRTAKTRIQNAIKVTASRLPEPPQEGTAAITQALQAVSPPTTEHGRMRNMLLDCAAYVLRRAIPFIALGQGALTGGAAGFIAGGVGGPAAMPIGAGIGAVVGALASLWQVRNGRDGMRPGGANDIVKNITGRGPEEKKGFILDRVTDGINKRLFKHSDHNNPFRRFAEDPAKPFDMVGVLRGMLRGAARASGKEMAIPDEAIQLALRTVAAKLGVQPAEIFKWMPAKTRTGSTKAVWSGEGARRPVYGARAARLLAGKADAVKPEQRQGEQPQQPDQPKKRGRIKGAFHKIGRGLKATNRLVGKGIGKGGAKAVAKKKSLVRKVAQGEHKIGRLTRFLGETSIGKDVKIELERRADRVEKGLADFESHGLFHGAVKSVQRVGKYALRKFSSNRRRYGLLPALAIEAACMTLTKGIPALVAGGIAVAAGGSGLAAGGAAVAGLLVANKIIKSLIGPAWKIGVRVGIEKGASKTYKMLKGYGKSPMGTIKNPILLSAMSELPNAEPTLLDVAKELRRNLMTRLTLEGVKAPAISLGRCILALNQAFDDITRSVAKPQNSQPVPA
jgi:hypothetical protein